MRAPLAFFLLSVWLAPAALGAADVPLAMLEIRVKDHREAIGDFSSLNISVGELRLSARSGLMLWQSSWKRLPVSTAAIDLTKYVGKNSARLFRGRVEAGTYEGIDLKLQAVDGVLQKNRKPAQIKNLVGPVKLSFDVRSGGETLVILDLVVLDMSDHPPKAYELGVRGYEIYTNGKLVDKVPPG